MTIAKHGMKQAEHVGKETENKARVLSGNNSGWKERSLGDCDAGTGCTRRPTSIPPWMSLKEYTIQGHARTCTVASISSHEL